MDCKVWQALGCSVMPEAIPRRPVRQLGPLLRPQALQCKNCSLDCKKCSLPFPFPFFMPITQTNKNYVGSENTPHINKGDHIGAQTARPPHRKIERRSAMFQ
eukprot:1147489-Pelagomonas_calceolata.AAC.7